MTRYKLWIHSDLLGEWTEPEKAREGVLNYIEQNPEEEAIIQFGAFKATMDRGLIPLYHLTGADSIKEHFDVD